MTKTIVKQYTWNLGGIEMNHIDYSDGSCIAVPTTPEGVDALRALRDLDPETLFQRLKVYVAESLRDERAWHEDAEKQLDLERRRICEQIRHEIERENRA